MIRSFGVDGRRFEAAVFADVANGEELQKRLGEMMCDVAIVDASLIVSWSHVESAAQRAVRRAGKQVVIKSNDSMKTRNIHSEFIYCLSPATSIGHSLKTFGVSSSCSHVMVAAFDADSQALRSVLDIVRGRPVSEFSYDRNRILTVFKISTQELTFSNLQSAVLNRIAIKDV